MSKLNFTHLATSRIPVCCTPCSIQRTQLAALMAQNFCCILSPGCLLIKYIYICNYIIIILYTSFKFIDFSIRLVLSRMFVVQIPQNMLVERSNRYGAWPGEGVAAPLAVRGSSEGEIMATGWMFNGHFRDVELL